MNCTNLAQYKRSKHQCMQVHKSVEDHGVTGVHALIVPVVYFNWVIFIQQTIGYCAGVGSVCVEYIASWFPCTSSDRLLNDNVFSFLLQSHLRSHYGYTK